MTANRPHGHVPNFPAWTVNELPEHTSFSMLFVRGGDDSTVEALRQELTDGPDVPDHLERARVVNTGDQATVFLGVEHPVFYAPSLAKFETQTVTEILAQRLPSLRLMEGQRLDYFPNITFRGPTQLNVAWI